jgi:hypothetical protein
MDYDKLQNQLFGKQSEKTFIDKILARQDVDAIRELIRKGKLTREQLLEILYMMSSSESKLWSFTQWDRYVILKYFVWVREFVKVAELLFDFEEYLNKQKEDNPDFEISKMTKKLINNNVKLIEHNIKFLIDLYFNIARTSLSVNATGFTEILNNKYEVSYDQKLMATPMQEKKPIVARGY